MSMGDLTRCGLAQAFCERNVLLRFSPREGARFAAGFARSGCRLPCLLLRISGAIADF